MNYNLDTYSDIPYTVDRGMTGKILFGMTWATNGILGYIVMLIALFMTIVTIFDILYLEVPFLGGLARKYNWDGSRSDKKLPISLISRDAIRAAEEALESEARGQFESKMLLYCKKRILSFMKVAIITAILMIGAEPIFKIAYSVVEPMLKGFGLI